MRMPSVYLSKKEEKNLVGWIMPPSHLPPPPSPGPCPNVSYFPVPVNMLLYMADVIKLRIL